MLPLLIAGLLGYVLSGRSVRRIVDPWDWGPPRLPPEWQRDAPPDEPPPPKPQARTVTTTVPTTTDADTAHERDRGRSLAERTMEPFSIKAWRAYPPPIPPAVVTRAQELLRDGMRPGQAPVYARDTKHRWVQYRGMWIDQQRTKRGVAALVPKV